MTLSQINQLDNAKVSAALLECCGSKAWTSRMLAIRPFHDTHQLFDSAEETWWNLTSEDWLEAFSKHPRIGDTRQLSKWSTQEQNGMSAVEDRTLQKLASLNEAYFQRFGWIYIVCATGKSASEMLAQLENRVSNESQEELRIAAREQAKITGLRIGKLLAE